MANSTITLQSVVNLASTHVDLAPLAGIGGYTYEPALSLCNDTLQELLAPPNPMAPQGFPWRHNRQVMTSLFTQNTKQDYLFAGACAFTLEDGGVGIGLASATAISESGTTVTVNTLEPHPFANSVGKTVYMLGNTVAAYNSSLSQTSSLWQYTGGWTITAVPTTTSFTFTHASSGLATSGAPGITDFGWLESATRFDANSTSPLMNVKQLFCYRELPKSPRIDNPKKVCVLKDDYAGTLTIRVLDVPGGSLFGMDLVYQAKAPVKTALSQVWDPFPDELSFVYRQMFMARCYRYMDNKRSEVEWQKAQIAILKGLGLKDTEQSDEYLAPERSFLEF